MSQTASSTPRILVLGALVSILGQGREADALDLNGLAFNASRALVDARERKAAQEVRARLKKAEVRDLIMAQQQIKKTPAEDAAKIDDGYLAEVAAAEEIERECAALEMAYDVARQRAWILALESELNARRKLIELQARLSDNAVGV